MPPIRQTLTIAALVGALVQAPVHAQDAGTPPPASDAETPVPDATPAPETGGEAGDPQAASPAEEPDVYVRETHGDWTVQCLRLGDDRGERCQILQILVDESANPTAEVSFVAVPPGQEVAGAASVTAPLETLLTEQLRISIDGDRARTYPFQYCASGGCVAQIAFTDDDMARLRRGAAAAVTIVPARAPDQTVALEMSLTGFTAGMAAITPEG